MPVREFAEAVRIKDMVNRKWITTAAAAAILCLSVSVGEKSWEWTPGEMDVGPLA